MTTVDLPSNVGPLLITLDSQGLIGLNFLKGGRKNPTPSETPSALLQKIEKGLSAYFEHGKPLPSIPLGKIRGTDFQLLVWQALKTIPFGETRSYGEIAQMIGRPKASRAVGTACGANPVALFIPCHRVLASGGGLGGFSGGLEVKRKLLQREGHAKINDKG